MTAHDERKVECTCRVSGTLHSITCMTTAVTQPHAMVDDHGDVYYPDNSDDADFFRDQYGARPISGLAFMVWYLAQNEEGTDG